MKEYTKTSLHNHLGGTSADKAINEPYNKKVFFDYKRAFKLLNEAKDLNYSLLALTQHNSLSVVDYVMLKTFSNYLGVVLLAGVEIDVKNEENGKYLHVIAVFNEKCKIIDISNTINEYVNTNQKNYLTLNQFINLIMMDKCIIIPHGTKSNNSSVTEHPLLLKELIDMSDSIPVVLEGNKQYHRDSLKAKLKDKLSDKEYNWIDETSIISTVDQSSFKDIESPTYMWGEPSFDDLYYSCFMSSKRFKRESDLIEKVCYVSKIVIDDDGKSQVKQSVINCSHGLNSIIGQSGSGKTLLLDIIKRKICGEGLDNKTISEDCKYEELYNVDNIHLFDKNDNEIKTGSYTIVEGETLYNKVISAFSSDRSKMIEELGLQTDTSGVQLLINKFNDSLNKYISGCVKIKKNKKMIESSLTLILSTIDFLKLNKKNSKDNLDYKKTKDYSDEVDRYIKRIGKIKADLNNINEIYENLKKYKNVYALNEEYQKDINKIERKLSNTLKYYLYDIEINNNQIRKEILIQELITNLSQNYNSKIGKNYETIYEKEKELHEQINNVVNCLIENINNSYLKIDFSISESEIKKSIGFEPTNNSKLDFQKIDTVITKDEFEKYFPNNIGKGKSPKIKKGEFSDCLDISSADSIKTFAQVFIDNNYDEPDVILNFDTTEKISYKIELKNDDGMFEDINTITAGSLSKIYIQRMFDEKINNAGSNAIVLYDQPDSNMEKSFIIKELTDKLSQIREKYQIFITTHEPLLVVNADSNNIIYAENEKTITEHNKISYSNKTYVGANSKKEYINEVAKLIDGDPEAVNRRSTIYGGLLNDYNKD